MESRISQSQYIHTMSGVDTKRRITKRRMLHYGEITKRRILQNGKITIGEITKRQMLQNSEITKQRKIFQFFFVKIIQ